MIFSYDNRHQLTTLKTAFVLACIGLVLIVNTNELKAQAETFTVTVEEKTQEHPYFGEGDNDGFVIDGVQGKELEVVRGNTYEFQMNNVESIHPFYLSTDPIGAGADPFEDGVSGAPATGNEVITFNPDAQTPDSIWYQCNNHPNMGWKIFVMDATSAEDEKVIPGSFSLHGNYPNPFNPRTNIEFDLAESSTISVQIYNQAGQRVMEIPAQLFQAGSAKVIEVNAANLNSGIYLYNLRIERGQDIVNRQGKMALIK